MNMKKQLALGGALLTATAAACLKLAQWAGKKIESRQKKKQYIRLYRLCLICQIQKTKDGQQMPQPTKAIISNEQKSGIRKGSNRASTGKVGALLLSVYI